MIEIVAGGKGKGKTKLLIRKANDNVLVTTGTIVYLDKDNKHMYELSNRIRLINVPNYQIDNYDMFHGFLAGIISQDHDLDKIYLDNYLSIAHVDDSAIEDAVIALDSLSNAFKVDIIISIAKDKLSLSDKVQSYVTVSL